MDKNQLLTLCNDYDTSLRYFKRILSGFLEMNEANLYWLARELGIVPFTVLLWSKGQHLPKFEKMDELVRLIKEKIS